MENVIKDQKDETTPFIETLLKNEEDYINKEPKKVLSKEEILFKELVRLKQECDIENLVIKDELVRLYWDLEKYKEINTFELDEIESDLLKGKMDLVLDHIKELEEAITNNKTKIEEIKSQLKKMKKYK